MLSWPRCGEQGGCCRDTYSLEILQIPPTATSVYTGSSMIDRLPSLGLSASILTAMPHVLAECASEKQWRPPWHRRRASCWCSTSNRDCDESRSPSRCQPRPTAWIRHACGSVLTAAPRRGQRARDDLPRYAHQAGRRTRGQGEILALGSLGCISMVLLTAGFDLDRGRHSHSDRVGGVRWVAVQYGDRAIRVSETTR